MSKIIIFGATGNTGLCSLRHAIDTGKIVKAFVRDEKKIPDDLKGKCQTYVGDVKNADQVAEAISGVDGVVVVLGTRNDLKPTTILSDGMKNIIKGMKVHGIEKVSVCLSAFLFYQPEKVPAVFKDLNSDHQRMLDVIKESNLKWVAVLPPHIADSTSSKYTIKFDESPGREISKYDLGSFLVDCLDDENYFQKIVGIAKVV